MTRSDAEAAYGPPARTNGALLRWCHAQGGKLAAGFRAGRLEFAFTTSPTYEAAGVHVGERRQRVKGAERLLRRGSVTVYALTRRRDTLLVGMDRKRVRYIAIAARRMGAPTADAWLDRTR